MANLDTEHEPRPPTDARRGSDGGRFGRSSLVQLTLARIREFVRQPEAMFWTFAFPILLALGLGVAFSGGEPAPVQVGVRAGPGSDTVAAALADAERIEAAVLEPEAAREALRRGDVSLVVVPGAEAVTYRYDRNRDQGRLARLVVDDALQRAAGRTDPRPVRDEPVEEEGSRYIDFLIPGLLGLNLLGTGLWGVGHVVVRMRTGRLLKRLTATPMRRGEFLLSFMLGRLVFLAVELAALLGFAWLIFDVPVRGSLAGVVFISTLGAFTFTGLGVLLASRARTTEAVMGLINVVSFPMWILSGVFFSSEHFPDVMQPFIEALPLTALLDALRTVMLEGAPVLATLPSLAIVTGWGVACFGSALAIFRWR